MNTSLKFLFVLTAVAALSVAYPAKANLITNPGFETGDFTGWTADSIGTGVIVANSEISPHSGNYHAFLNPSRSNTGTFINQNITTTIGTVYTVSFWAATPSLNVNGTPPGTLSVNWGGSTVFSHVFGSITG
jgi:hypothetical protein